MSADWPRDAASLVEVQLGLACLAREPWVIPEGSFAVAGCFVCFERGGEGPGAEGDAGWAAATLLRVGRTLGSAVVRGRATAAYEPGLLALREGPLLDAAIRALPQIPDVLFVNATGCDHPRRAGLALHLGAVLGVPSVGVTHRPLVARGEWPPDEQGASAPLTIDGELVGYWVRTRAGTRPLAISAAWRTSAEVARDVTLRLAAGHRTPEPLRRARELARTARAQDSGVSPASQ